MAQDRVHESARAGAGMVATPDPRATEAGRAVLEEGGNAVEAALAAAATLAVVAPHLCQLGGDGFWLIRDPAGRVATIDATGPAGAGATPSLYRAGGPDEIPVHGPLAALTVPGQLGGWGLALEAARAFGGRMPLRRLLEAALEQARAGIAVSPALHRAGLRAAKTGLNALPGFRAAFLEPDGTAPAAGAVMRCERLADTLDHLASAGLDDFYRGDVGREIAADLERAGSPVTRADLAAFRAVTRRPLAVKLPDIELWCAAPPAQGLSSLLTLALFARLDVARPEGFAHVHGLIEAGKRALAVRATLIAERDLLLYDPAAAFTPAALAREAAAIDMRRAAPWPARAAAGDPLEPGAAWLGAGDRTGVIVSYVQSNHGAFGAGLVLPATGVLMNSRGASLSPDPRAANALMPGRRPPLTPAPGLMRLPDGRVIAFGAGGGEEAPQAETAVMSRYALFGMPLGEAFAAPRWRLDGRLNIEAGLDEAVADRLDAAGHDVEIVPAAFDDLMGHAGAVILHPGRGGLEGAHDPRGDGDAAGL